MEREKLIDAKSLSFSYTPESSAVRALDDVSFEVSRGELVAILGRNGSGKTTFVRQLNALLPVQSGELTVAGLDAKDANNIWRIRQKCGMVFQNPDNQFVSGVVGEDIAFGMRSFDTPEEDIPQKVVAALEAVGLFGFERRSPQLLSCGQKQRVAIAGVLAVDPDVIILDEATSMLDVDGRREVLAAVKRLREAGRTIILTSHNTEDAAFADRAVILLAGKILAQGTPRELLSDLELLKQAGLTPPLPVRLYYDLMKSGIELSQCPITLEELVEAVCQFR